MVQSYYRETESLDAFKRFSPFYHLYSQEDFEIIFDSKEVKCAGMNIFGICSIASPNVKVFCFELMSNHYHAVISGECDAVLDFARTFSELLSRYFKDRNPSLSKRLCDWKYEIRPIESINDARNVIAYSNRNGFLANNDVTPFNYPWGSNRCYFSPDAQARFQESTDYLTVREIRQMVHSAKYDVASGVKKVDGYISPFGFCKISETESLFRDIKQFLFLHVSKIEEIDSVACGTNVNSFLSDDEAYEKVKKYCSEKFKVNSPMQATRVQVIDAAEYMRVVLHSSDKQIMRILGLSSKIGI